MSADFQCLRAGEVRFPAELFDILTECAREPGAVNKAVT
jgi:hypothetical protein